MRRLLHTPAGMLLRRIALLYAVLMLCRAAFWAYNAAQLGALPQTGLRQLLGGALLFDTASVVYADGLFVLLSLLPLHLRERRWYRNLLFGYYVAVNSLFVVAANLADAVYFRYTQKRFTADEIFFADNDNSLQLVGKFMAENWYLVLAWLALTALLAWGYGRRVREESLLRRGWPYHAGGTAILLLAAGLCIGGARGGFTRMTRPITLSNATLYASDNAQANLILSNPFCILRTVGSAGGVGYRKFFPPEELGRWFTPIHMPADSAAVDLSGRNVMVFIMESMSAEHSAHLRPDLYADRPEKGFTPFLDSLMRNGLCFRRMYANGTRSIQAMPSVLGSIPSFRTPFVLMPQSLGASRQLPAILADKGYSTVFFCGSEHGSMGFGAYARSAGIAKTTRRATARGTSTATGASGTKSSCNSRARSSPPYTNLSSPRCSPSRLTIRSSFPSGTPRRFRRATPESTRAWPTTTWPSGASSNGSAAKRGSAARSSSSWPTTSPRRNSRPTRESIPATCTSSVSSTRPTAPCGARWTTSCSNSTSCPRCWDSRATTPPISPSDATC